MYLRLSLLLPVLLAGTVFPLHADSLPDVIDGLRPSVVAVGKYSPTANPRQEFRGTGFVVGDGRHVVTNHHVLPTRIKLERKERIAVFSGRGRQVRYHPATVVAEDPVHDLALLRIDATLKAMSLGRAASVREGEDIAFTGFPLGMALGLYPVTHRGIVSAISPIAPPTPKARALSARLIRAMRESYDVLQLDATAYPGNSGSPVYDRETGRVIGVVNSVLVKSSKEAAIRTPTGITYAIPIRFVRELLEEAR